MARRGWPGELGHHERGTERESALLTARGRAGLVDGDKELGHVGARGRRPAHGGGRAGRRRGRRTLAHEEPVLGRAAQRLDVALAGLAGHKRQRDTARLAHAVAVALARQHAVHAPTRAAAAEGLAKLAGNNNGREVHGRLRAGVADVAAAYRRHNAVELRREHCRLGARSSAAAAPPSSAVLHTRSAGSLL